MMSAMGCSPSHQNHMPQNHQAHLITEICRRLTAKGRRLQGLHNGETATYEIKTASQAKGPIAAGAICSDLINERRLGDVFGTPDGWAKSQALVSQFRTTCFTEFSSSCATVTDMTLHRLLTLDEHVCDCTSPAVDPWELPLCFECGQVAYRIVIAENAIGDQRKIPLCGRHFVSACLAIPDMQRFSRSGMLG